MKTFKDFVEAIDENELYDKVTKVMLHHHEGGIGVFAHMNDGRKNVLLWKHPNKQMAVDHAKKIQKQTGLLDSNIVTHNV